MAQDMESLVRELALEHAARFGDVPGVWRAKASWASLRGSGTELWLDTGDMTEADALWTADFSGLTTNNTWLNVEVQKGIYDPLIADTSRRLAGLADLRERVREVAFLLNAVHGLRLARRFGCRVSVELHTDFADDVEETLRHARRFHAISPDRFIVKVPLTAAGLVAVRRLSAEGIPVNLTVGFSARQNYLAAVLSRPAFVNVFVGRIGAFLTENGFGDGIPAAVRAARSSQRAVAEARRQAGAPTRQIIASLRAVAYVTALAGADVFTINTAVARAWEAAPGAVAPVHFDALPPTGLGADAESALGAACLWDVPAAFQSATQRLAQTAPAALTPQALRGELAQAGFASLLRPWSPDERLSAREDGLLPKYSRWKDALARGEVALDSLFNLAVFMAFVKDQEGMDRRIAGLIGR